MSFPELSYAVKLGIPDQPNAVAVVQPRQDPSSELSDQQPPDPSRRNEFDPAITQPWPYGGAFKCRQVLKAAIENLIPPSAWIWRPLWLIRS